MLPHNTNPATITALPVITDATPPEHLTYVDIFSLLGREMVCADSKARKVLHVERDAHGWFVVLDGADRDDGGYHMGTTMERLQDPLSVRVLASRL